MDQDRQAGTRAEDGPATLEHELLIRQLLVERYRPVPSRRDRVAVPGFRDDVSRSRRSGKR